MRYSVRALARTPGFTAALILSGAIGIGVNAVVFGFIGHLVDPAVMPDADLAGWQSRISTIQLLLVTVAVFVFLIAAASVSGLMLSRAAARVHETSVRVALGAHGRMLIRPLLAEGLVVAVASTALGILAAFWTVRGLPALFYAEDIEAIPLVVDWQGVIVAAALGVSVVCAGALAPLLWTSRSRPAPDSRGTGPGLANTFGGWRSTLVIGQLTLCAVLLISAASVVDHLEAALRTDYAVQTGDAIVVKLERVEVLDGFTGGLRAVVGDRPIAIVQSLPGGLTPTLPFRLTPTDRDADAQTMGVNVIDGEHLSLSGLMLVVGRSFDAADAVRAPRVAIANLEAAALITAATGLSPLGHRIVDPDGRTVEIVGLVREAPFRTLQSRAAPTLYLPYRQNYPASMFLIAGGNQSWSPSTVDAVAARLATVRRGRFVSATTLQEHLHKTAAPADRLVTTIVQVFAALALLLSLVGVTGVTTDAVTRRTAEIALRVALGAPRWRIVSGVVSYGARLAFVGASAGVVICLVGFRFVTPLPDGTRGPALWFWVVAILVLITVVMAGSLLPARRALAVDPSRLLRE